ncbi:MAG: TRAP transporter substrate-binding protein [Marinobacter sp.]|nr:TRAP transporter substrate-binding protein [Marinobacter sp.]
MKTKLMNSVAAITATMALSTAAQAADYTLRFAHFWPAVSPIHKEVFQSWANQIEADSDGRIEVELYPGGTLSKPPAQYEAVINRIADVTATVQGYTANRFPLTQIVELPGIVKTAEQGSCVIQGLYDEKLITEEYSDTHPVFLFTHGQGHLHTMETPIRKPSDLEGLRIRRPTQVVASLLEELGAAPVGMPAPESYQSMQRGVIDGVALPWEGVHSFRINELANHHTEIGLYSLSFVVTMNKQVYNSMPEDLQQIIDQNSGMENARSAGETFDKVDALGRKDAVEAGHEIITLENATENEAWKPVLDSTIENYLQKLEDQGLPARDVYQRAVELSDECQQS